MNQSSVLTLSQGLEKFRKEFKDYHSHTEEGITEEAKVFFESHDIAHVVFGCDISLFGEGSVKIWTIFGTTLGFWKHLKGYREANAFRLSRNFSFGHVIRNIFKFLFAIPNLIIRARQMTKPWPWAGYETYLDMSILEIRKEFNIRIHP